MKKKQARRRPKGPVARAIAVRQRTERRRVRNSLSVAKETKKRKAASLLLPYVAIDVYIMPRMSVLEILMEFGKL